jgi:enoyl-CoA hydratase
VRNPLSVTILDELEQIVETCLDESELKGLIFTGTDDVFASGADLREIQTIDPLSAADFARRGQSLMNKIAGLPQTVVAAINGFCFGGALDLVLACDLRIASPNAAFAHPGAGLGIITGWGGTQRLPRMIGQGRALEMFLTAEPINADKALAWGLIDEIGPDPVASALAATDLV